MAEQATYSTERLDHLGIVAGICREIEQIERVDTLVDENDRKGFWRCSGDKSNSVIYSSHRDKVHCGKSIPFVLSHMQNVN